MRCGDTKAHLSYTDDIGILGIGYTVRESAIIAQREFDSIIKLTEENAVLFDA